jgi:hypothetical protein
MQRGLSVTHINYAREVQWLQSPLVITKKNWFCGYLTTRTSVGGWVTWGASVGRKNARSESSNFSHYCYFWVLQLTIHTPSVGRLSRSIKGIWVLYNDTIKYSDSKIQRYLIRKRQTAESQKRLAAVRTSNPTELHIHLLINFPWRRWKMFCSGTVHANCISIFIYTNINTPDLPTPYQILHHSLTVPFTSSLWCNPHVRHLLHNSV